MESKSFFIISRITDLIFVIDMILSSRLAYIDSKVNIVRTLQPTDQIQVLLQGRFRDGQLRKLDEVLAVKLTHKKPIEQEEKKGKKAKNTNTKQQEYETQTFVFHNALNNLINGTYFCHFLLKGC